MLANNNLDILVGALALHRMSLDAALPPITPHGGEGFAAHLDPGAGATTLSEPPGETPTAEGASAEDADPQAEGDAHLALLLAYL